MDDLKQTDNAHSHSANQSFEKWVAIQFQGQGFFPDIQSAPTRQPAELVFRSGDGLSRFRVECIWKKMLSGPWKWTAHTNGKNERYFLALGIGGDPENPSRTFFIEVNLSHQTVYISAYRLSQLRLLAASDVITMVKAA